MIIVHYNEKTGKVIQAYNSSIDNIPVPNIEVHENQWSKIYNKDLWVDLTTKIIIAKERIPSLETQKGYRASCYIQEADPLYFKYRRGEATEEEWLNKIQEIKDRFPYPEDVKITDAKENY